MMKSKVSIAVCLLLSMLDFAAGAESKFVPKSSEFTLPNGLRIILMENHQQPMVDFVLQFKTGALSDPADLSGLTAVTLEMLKEGTRAFPGDVLMNSVDSAGGTIVPVYGYDGMALRGSFLSRDTRFAFDILSEIIIHPQFDEQSLEHLKKRLTSLIMQRNSVVRYRLVGMLNRTLYGDAGYGLSAEGTQAGIRKIGIEDVREFYRKYFLPGNAVLIVAGDFKPDGVKSLIRKSFAGWQRGSDQVGLTAKPTLPDTLRIIIMDNPEVPSTEFVIGRPAVAAGTGDYAALMLLDYLLGGGGDISRLSQSLIRDRGLVTQISSQINWARGEGVMYIYGSSTNEMAAEAVKQTLEVLDNLKNIKVPARELEGAKNFYRGIIPGYFETTYSSMMMLAKMIVLGQKFDYYDRILRDFDSAEPGRLRKIAEQYLDKNHLTIVVSGPESVLKRGLSQSGSVEVISSGRN